MNMMKIESGGQIFTVELNDSKTTADFTSWLPLSLTMELYNDREYYSVLGFRLSSEGEHIENFKNGDVTYFPEINTLAIFFAKEGISSQSGLIRIGRIVSGLGAFEKMNNKEKFELSLL